MSRRLARKVLLLGALGLALLGCTPGSASPTPTAAGSPPPGAVILELAASGMAFDRDELHVRAGEVFAVLLRNDDRDLHNFELRDEAGTSLFRGELFAGPGERQQTLPALGSGSYQFLCTAHPYMKGVLIAD